MRAWLSVVRPMSSLLTILLVSLLWCVKVDTLGTPCKVDLDWVPNHFIYFYITDKLYFYFIISFWYPHFFLLPINPLVHNWELSLPLLLACHSKHLFCPFQQQILGDAQDPKVCTPLTGTFSTNNYHSHFLCQLLTLLVGLQSFLGQITNMLSLSQRWEVDEVHLVIRRRIWKGQESLRLVLAILLFHSSDAVCLKVVSQISLVFLFFPLCLFLLLFSLCLFF